MSQGVKGKRVVVLSPSVYSLYTLGTIVCLQRAGVQVAGVGFRRLLNPRRLLQESRRDGARLMKKIWNKLLFRNWVYRVSGKETISQFLKDNDIPLKRVSVMCKSDGIPTRYCYDFNDANFVDWIKGVSADAIVFTGGGLIRQPLLEATPKGVLNCHMGILPMYRGMDLPEWAILRGQMDQIGCTVHVMESGVDTGPILSTRFVPPRSGDTIRSLRDRIEYHMTSEIVNTAVAYLENRILPQTQSVEDGKQFFIMTPLFVDIVERRLAAYAHH